MFREKNSEGIWQSFYRWDRIPQDTSLLREMIDYWQTPLQSWGFLTFLRFSWRCLHLRPESSLRCTAILHIVVGCLAAPLALASRCQWQLPPPTPDLPQLWQLWRLKISLQILANIWWQAKWPPLENHWSKCLVYKRKTFATL